MRILFDQGTPVPLRAALHQHEVVTAFELGWSRFQNGELLDAAEREHFEVLVTTDRHLRHQQRLPGRRIAIVVLTSTSWRRIQRSSSRIGTTIAGIAPGQYIEIEIV